MNLYCLNCHSVDDSWTHRSRSCTSAHCSSPATSSEVDEVPTSSQRFAEWQEEQALLTLHLQQRVLPLKFPFSFPFPFENTMLPSCLAFLFSCQCSGKPGVDGVLFVKSLEVLLWTSSIGDMCISNENYTFYCLFRRKKQKPTYIFSLSIWVFLCFGNLQRHQILLRKS